MRAFHGRQPYPSRGYRKSSFPGSAFLFAAPGYSNLVMPPARLSLLLSALLLGLQFAAPAQTKEEYERANPQPALEALPTVSVQSQDGREVTIRLVNGTSQDLVYDEWTIAPVFHWQEKDDDGWTFRPSPVCSMSWTAKTLPAGKHIDFIVRLSPHAAPATAYLRLRSADGGKASFLKIYEFVR